MNQAVICTLQGQGDRSIFLISPQALEWCERIKPGTCSIPSEIRASLAEFLEDSDDAREALDGELDITRGSAENDAMLHLSCCVRQFDTQREALAFAGERGLEVVAQEYDGCIY